MSGSVPCPSCGQPVLRGRLACPACGSLVASVARSVPPAEAAPASSDARQADATEAADAVAPATAPAPATSMSMPAVAASRSVSEPEPEPVAAPEPEPEPVAAPEPDADLEAKGGLAAATLAGNGVASGGIVPGAYLPPSTVHRPTVAPSGGPSWPSGPPSLPAEWPPSPVSAAPGPAPWAPTAGAAGVTPPAAAAPVAAAPAATGAATDPDRRPLVPGRASILADLPFDAPDEIEGWLVVLGAGVSVLAFFLPWRDSLGEGLDGYFGSWGLGIAAHLPIFVLVVVVLALAVLPNRVASWVRTGVLGMVVGGILFGLVWLYLEGGASQLGALFGAVGAVLMIAGGVIAVAPGRSNHPSDDG